jgi:hypothetical protein
LSSKSQIFSADMNVSLFLFITFTLFSIFLFNYSSTEIDDYISMRDMQNLAVLSTDSIIRSPGFPNDWNHTNVRSLGLADEENVINYSKMMELSQVDYFLAKTLLTQRIYEFYINITEFNGTSIMIYGNDDTSSSATILPYTRFCLLDEGFRRPVYLHMVIWI